MTLPPHAGCQAPCFPTRAPRLRFTPQPPPHPPAAALARDLPSALPTAAGATFERLTLDRVVCSKGSCVLLQHVECSRPSVFSGGLVPGRPSPPCGYQNAWTLKSQM